MSKQAYEQLTLFPGDSRASRFPWLESKKEKGTTVTFGRKCSGLSENLRRVGLLVRTYLESSSLPGEQFVRTWSVRDTLSPFLILKLRLSERHTEGIGCSLLPTVTATVATHGGPNQRDSSGRPGLQMAAMMWQTPSVEDAGRTGSAEAWKQYAENGRTTQCRLRNQVAMWPTPRASKIGGYASPDYSPTLEQAVMFATPQARDFRTGQMSRWEDENRSRNLNDQIGGQLNPTWVEWLMGFPPGWTDLNASETP